MIGDIDIDIDSFNPYPSFRPGQKEAIAQILDLHKKGYKIIELSAPTASGKSLDLYILGKMLTENQDGVYAVYSTPLVALVNQLKQADVFHEMPTLKGKKNYLCPFLSRDDQEPYFADDCPFDTWETAIRASMEYDHKDIRETACATCVYQREKEAFMEARFGATTFARYMIDHNIRSRASILLIDESSGLEKTLVDRVTMKLHPSIDLNDIRESLVVYLHRRIEQKNSLERDIGDKWDSRPSNPGKEELKAWLKDFKELTKQKKECESEIRKASKAIAHIDYGTPYIIDKDRCFRILEGTKEFEDLCEDLDLVVLASGTPTTFLLTQDYETVSIQHPIPLDRRLIYEYPVGLMNYEKRSETVLKMAPVIENLHNKYHRHTIVHCGAYGIAKMIYDHLSPSVQKETILQDRNDREGSKLRWMNKPNSLFLSVEFVEGLDLKGPEYPMNIIAKVPFEPIKDEFVVARNDHDNKKRYNVYAAVEVMQAAGRTTRTKDDYSETYILDSSWQSFHRRYKKLFHPWFDAACLRCKQLSEVKKYDW